MLGVVFVIVRAWQSLQNGPIVSGQVTLFFDIKVNYGGGDGGGDGSKQGVRRERFEWRKIGKGTDDTAKEENSLSCLSRRIPL